MNRKIRRKITDKYQVEPIHKLISKNAMFASRVTSRTVKPIDQSQVGNAAVLMAGDDNRKRGWLKICLVGY